MRPAAAAAVPAASAAPPGAPLPAEPAAQASPAWQTGDSPATCEASKQGAFEQLAEQLARATGGRALPPSALLHAKSCNAPTRRNSPARARACRRPGGGAAAPCTAAGRASYRLELHLQAQTCAVWDWMPVLQPVASCRCTARRLLRTASTEAQPPVVPGCRVLLHTIGCGKEEAVCLPSLRFCWCAAAGVERTRKRCLQRCLGTGGDNSAVRASDCTLATACHKNEPQRCLQSERPG